MKSGCPLVSVLYGGVGPEREVSLLSGEAVAAALATNHQVRAIRLDEAALPVAMDPREGVVFPVLHGLFGEDGQVQALLEAGGFEYVGCDSLASALCMNKVRTKQAVQPLGVGLAPHRLIGDGLADDLQAVVAALGEELIVKPVNEGSSSNLHVVRGRAGLEKILDCSGRREWLVERRIFGREFSVGVLHGAGLGIVEIVAEGGVYDYERKYTKGLTEYRFPAQLEADIERQMRTWAEGAFSICGCRDFARVDFMLEEATSQIFFLEINTLPGMTELSLFPRSASCRGYTYHDLVDEMVKPALNRFNRRKAGAL